MDLLSGISWALPKIADLLSSAQGPAGGLASSLDDWCGTKPPGPPIPLGSTLLEKLGLNPQPLPPKEAMVGGLDKAFGGALSLDDDWCGTVPKRFPPPPPPPLGGLLQELMGGMMGAR